MKLFFLNSVKYIIVSGASKGLNYLILLYFAVGIYSEQYVIILLLLSLEQLLSLFLPLNNSNIIYSKNITSYNVISNKLISTSILIVLIYILFFLFFQTYFYRYFGIDNLLVYVSIFISMIINGYMVYLTNYYKVIEKHNKALLVQSFYFITFIVIITLVLLLENKILAFFLGKATGLVLVLLLLKIYKLDFTKFKIAFLSKKEYKSILNLFSVSILGWLSGLGFMNLAKIYASQDNLVLVGYMLNLWNIFLLLSTGINAVYHPLIKKFILQNNFKKAVNVKTKALFIYLGLSLLIYLFYLIIFKLQFLENYPKINAVFSMLPYTLLLFVFSIFYYVTHPFYLAYEKFGLFNIINLLSHTLWFLSFLLLTYLGFDNYIWFLILLYFIKSMTIYLYAESKLMIIKS